MSEDGTSMISLRRVTERGILCCHQLQSAREANSLPLNQSQLILQLFYQYIEIYHSKISLQDSGEQGSHIHSVFTGLLSFIIYKSTQSSEKFWFPHPLKLWAAAEPRGSSPFKRISIIPNLSFLLRVCSHHHVMIFVPSLRHPHTHCVLAETQ